MASPAMPRKLSSLASDAARGALGFGSAGPGDDAVPWDVVAARLEELLRFLASALQALVAALQDRAAALGRWAQAAAPHAVAMVAVLLFLCCCCGCCRPRRRRGPDGEEVPAAGGGPVVRYRRGGGGVFSMHPNKPIV